MRKVFKFGKDLNDEDAEIYRITLLETRVRGLELIVHRLLKDRVDQNKANLWLDLTDDIHSIAMCASTIESLGREVASEIDCYPGGQKGDLN